jgi:hypothetical protein
LPTYSGSKNKISKKSTGLACHLLDADFLLGYFYPEDGLKNVAPKL